MKKPLSLVALLVLCITASKAQTQYIRNTELFKSPIENSDSCNVAVGIAYMQYQGLQSLELKLYTTSPTTQVWTNTFTVNSTSDINTLLVDEGMYTQIPIGVFLCTNRYRASVKLLGAGGSELASKIVDEQ